MQWNPFEHRAVYYLSSCGAFIFADALENIVVCRFSPPGINR